MAAEVADRWHKADRAIALFAKLGPFLIMDCYDKIEWRESYILVDFPYYRPVTFAVFAKWLEDTRCPKYAR